MVAIPVIAPYLPVESPSLSPFSFIHFCINRLYDIIKNELNYNKLLKRALGELMFAVTYYLLIKEHARVCQSAPCMFYCIRLSFFLKMYKFDFFPDLQIYVDMLLFVPVFHAAAQLHFPFFLSPGGIGELPNKRDLWHCIYTMNTNPLLATFWNFFNR